TVRTAATGSEALSQVAAQMPGLIVLDLMLPDIDGIEVCKRIRQTSDVPILMLTARDEDVDKIIGLEVGADDYLTKPFNPRELVARVKSILRRAAPDRHRPGLGLQGLAREGRTQRDDEDLGGFGVGSFGSLRVRLPLVFLAGIALAGVVTTVIAIQLFQSFAHDQALTSLNREATGVA